MNGKLGLIHVILTKKVCLAPDCLPAVSRALFELSLLENKPSGEGGRRREIRKDKVPAHATVILAEEAAGTHCVHCVEVTGQEEGESAWQSSVCTRETCERPRNALLAHPAHPQRFSREARSCIHVHRCRSLHREVCRGPGPAPGSSAWWGGDAGQGGAGQAASAQANSPRLSRRQSWSTVLRD